MEIVILDKKPMSNKKLPKVIWGNIIFFIYILGASIVGVISRHQDPNWASMADVRLKYDMLFGLGFSLLCIVASIGLILRKKWGWEFALSLNLLVLFVSFILRVGVYIWTYYSYSEGVLVTDIDSITMSIFSIFFIFAISNRRIREQYL